MCSINGDGSASCCCDEGYTGDQCDVLGLNLKHYFIHKELYNGLSMVQTHLTAFKIKVIEVYGSMLHLNRYCKFQNWSF